MRVHGSISPIGVVILIVAWVVVTYILLLIPMSKYINYKFRNIKIAILKLKYPILIENNKKIEVKMSGKILEFLHDCEEKYSITLPEKYKKEEYCYYDYYKLSKFFSKNVKKESDFGKIAVFFWYLSLKYKGEKINLFFPNKKEIEYKMTYIQILNEESKKAKMEYLFYY